MENKKMDTQVLTEKFLDCYGGKKDDIRIYFAPGRVNLIGEHTDYNGGFVLPCSLHCGTYLFTRTIHDPFIKLKSMDMPLVAEICADERISRIGNTWMNYPLGVMKEFQVKGFRLPGMAMLFSGDIPNGAGLSSSASIEMVTAFAVNDLGACNLEMIDLVKLSQHAENEFVGMNCGIMDQFAVGLGKKDHAIFINCDTLDYELVPLILGDYRLIITNTNKRRELAGSKYNERRAECESAVNRLSQFKSIRNLSELNLSEFIELEGKISDQTIRSRAKHVITENNRVLEGIKYLRSKNLEGFGKLMYQSHESLRDDYEVSCKELDILVDLASETEGVLGSRMTGAGFGGCTVSLVHKDQTINFIEAVGENYFKITNKEASFFIAEVGNGAMKVN